MKKIFLMSMISLMSLTACGSRPHGILQKDSSLAGNEDVKIQKLSDTTMDFINNKNEMPKNEDITKRKENDTSVQFYAVLGGINSRDYEQEKISELKVKPTSDIKEGLPTKRRILTQIGTQEMALIREAEKIFYDDFKRLPVVDHEGNAMIKIVKHIKTCIDEESVGTQDEYNGTINLKIRFRGNGIVKLVNFTDEANIPVYIQGCLLSGVYRVIFPQAFDGDGTLIQKSIKMSLKNPEENQEKKVSITILPEPNKILTM
jgi:hypothetical protein